MNIQPRQSDSVWDKAFAENVEAAKPFSIRNAEMLDVVGAFEAIIRSMADGGPVKVR